MFKSFELRRTSVLLDASRRIAAIAAFAAANIDDVFMLMGWLADSTLERWQIYAGQFLGFGVLALASGLCAVLAVRIPGHYLALLGIGPILLGLQRLWKPGADEAVHADHHAAKILTVASVTIVSGADDIAVFVPMMTSAGKSAILLIAAVFIVMTALWCVIATLLVSHPVVAKPLERWGDKLMSFVLIGLGVYILVA